jgi:hypothetical protein
MVKSRMKETPTSVKNEAIYANFLVACNAHSLYELLLIAYCRQRTHEPTVTVIALSYIVRSRASYEEFRLVEDVL